MCHLMPTYWHATTWRIWRNLIDGHMRVTRGHDLCRPIIMRIPRLLLRCYYLILNSFEYGEYVMLNKPTVPRRVPLLVQKLPTLPEHLSSIPVFSGDSGGHVFVSYSFGHCIVCPSNYGLWLPLWYNQTFLTNMFSFHLYCPLSL